MDDVITILSAPAKRIDLTSSIVLMPPPTENGIVHCFAALLIVSNKPFVIGLFIFIIDHSPPISIAPTPKKRIFVFHIFQATSSILPSIGIKYVYIGIAIIQLITPPRNTSIPIFIPTIYPTPINAGDKSQAIPNIDVLILKIYSIDDFQNPRAW